MIVDPEINVHLYGSCPIQGEGTIDGHAAYFRARGNRWSLSIGGRDVIDEPSWYYEEPYGDDPFDASYMPIIEAEAFIIKAVTLFRSGTPSMSSEVWPSSPVQRFFERPMRDDLRHRRSDNDEVDGSVLSPGSKR